MDFHHVFSHHFWCFDRNRNSRDFHHFKTKASATIRAVCGLETAPGFAVGEISAVQMCGQHIFKDKHRYVDKK